MTGIFETFWELFSVIWVQWEFLFSPFVNVISTLGVQIVKAFAGLTAGILNIINFFVRLFGLILG